MKYSVRKMRINEEGCLCASPVLCVRSVGAKVGTSLLLSSSLRLVLLMSRQITSCLADFTSCCDVADAETCFAASPVAKRKGSRKGKRKLGKGNEWWGGGHEMGLTLYIILTLLYAYAYERTLRWRTVSNSGLFSPGVYSGSSGTGNSCLLCCSRRRLLSNSSCWAALVTASNWCSLSSFLHKTETQESCIVMRLCKPSLQGKRRWTCGYALISWWMNQDRSNCDFFSPLIAIYSWLTWN